MPVVTMQREVVGVEERLPTLAGKRVGFAGRLLSCDRERARELVLRAGGTVSRRSVDVLVVAGGKPGAQSSGAHTISEGDFLRLIAALGMENPGDESVRELVSAQQAMRLYPRMTWARRRTLARHGLIQPVTFANGVGYRFRDLRTLRDADDLLGAGLTLSQVVARLQPRLLGQLELRFPMAAVKPRPRRVDLEAEAESAEVWFDVGFCADRDRSKFPTAIAAYERALRIDPEHVPSLINLGNVYYELGQFEKSRDLYARAAGIDPLNPRTHFNLGNASDEVGDFLGAARAYRKAIALWPGYADAHFNLALVAEKLVSWNLACRHWQRFLELEPRSDWAAVARSHLDDARRANGEASKHTPSKREKKTR